MKQYSKPIVSQSLAINPCQAAEHRRMFPYIKLVDDQFPVFDNYQEHDAYLNEAGFVKQTNGCTKKRTRHGIATLVEIAKHTNEPCSWDDGKPDTEMTEQLKALNANKII